MHIFFIMVIAEIRSMNPKPTVLLVGKDITLSYLFNRFTEQSGYQLAPHTDNISIQEIEVIQPIVILFLSIELLAEHQALVTELANRELPILVCSATADEARSRELGADYCLFHPLSYHEFQSTLDVIITSKHT